MSYEVAKALVYQHQARVKFNSRNLMINWKMIPLNVHVKYICSHKITRVRIYGRQIVIIVALCVWMESVEWERMSHSRQLSLNRIQQLNRPTAILLPVQTKLEQCHNGNQMKRMNFLKCRGISRKFSIFRIDSRLSLPPFMNVIKFCEHL